MLIAQPGASAEVLRLGGFQTGPRYRMPSPQVGTGRAGRDFQPGGMAEHCGNTRKNSTPLLPWMLPRSLQIVTRDNLSI